VAGIRHGDARYPITFPESHAMTSAVMPTYQRAPVAFTHGEGCRLFDRDGRR